MPEIITLKDYSNLYSDLVTFNINNFRSRHRWYPLVEGFSSELVRTIIGELNDKPTKCLDPFGGVGTTSLTCQELGIRCRTIESNPFFYEVSRAKLRNDYDPTIIKNFVESLASLKNQKPIVGELPELESKTFFESKNKKKWIFDRDVAHAIIEIISLIDKKFKDDKKYSILFRVGLSTLLVPFSNVFRNGKCLSYKKKWNENSHSRNDVIDQLIDYCNNILLVDIRTTQNFDKVANFVDVTFGDSREKIKTVEDESIDLVITSPPYLNSRDYTDIYRLELWILGYVANFDEERSIRKSALTSHVQVELQDFQIIDNQKLIDFVDHLNNLNGRLWNKNIPNMIKGYFYDMYGILFDLRNKLKPGGRIYLNVSNSAYGNEICYVDEILFEIAEKIGYKGIEIREARKINSSRQQNLPEKLRESVIVLEK